ncbi:MAG: HAMP domain-containing histidine kinase [Trueperaceae bacterium]|nr:HAMP domain-containing histidine kinase [Trueperaceae bacterium]MCO5174466.1 HAMP domain-containing histidine kinase [Trueperaceae bacterium]MCW5820011.1 HAMP domain-containing histidine kinase [Trueperaceae bacterium]
MKLRLQLTIVFGAFIAVILSAVAVSVYVLTERSLAVGITDSAERALGELTSGGSSITQAVQKLPSNTYYQVLIVGLEGRIPESVASLRSSATYDGNSNLLGPLSDAAAQTFITTGEVGEVVSVRGEQIRVLGRLAPVTFPAQGVTFQAAVLVGVRMSLMAQTLDQLARDLIATVLIAFLVFALGVWLLSERVLGPLKRVTAAASKVSGSELSQRVPVPVNRDEIRELGVTINHMLDRLQESFETQRRFTADASHELRTPVTAIGGHVNYLLRRTGPTPDQVESLEVIRRESERMGKLVNDLLELARADAGFTVHLEPMNLVEVVEAVKQEVAPVAGGAKIHVRASTPLAEVMGDFTRLKQVLLNLVQNALNAGAKNVTVTLRPERSLVHLEVLDDGAGIPADALPHLFERFFRVDGARSTRGNGSGLGLAIVKWIVQQHGGTVSVESRLGEGTVFTVTVPALEVRNTMDLAANVRATLVDNVIGRVRPQ